MQTRTRQGARHEHFTSTFRPPQALHSECSRNPAPEKTQTHTHIHARVHTHTGGLMRDTMQALPDPNMVNLPHSPIAFSPPHSPIAFRLYLGTEGKRHNRRMKSHNRTQAGDLARTWNPSTTTPASTARKPKPSAAPRIPEVAANCSELQPHLRAIQQARTHARTHARSRARG